MKPETAAQAAKRQRYVFRSIMQDSFRGYTARERDLELSALLRAVLEAAAERVWRVNNTKEVLDAVLGRKA